MYYMISIRTLDYWSNQTYSLLADHIFQFPLFPEAVPCPRQITSLGNDWKTSGKHEAVYLSAMQEGRVRMAIQSQVLQHE